jgi:Family of unknown function (DUF6464)
MTEASSLPTEVFLTQSREVIAKIRLDWTPQPGNYLDLDGLTYVVLERRHRYQLKFGRYQLNKIAIYVQTATRPEEQSLIDGQWVIGDATCGYNARSTLLRCAIHPIGPCDGCRYYEKRRALEDLNPRHSVLETDVLPTELRTQM